MLRLITNLYILTLPLHGLELTKPLSPDELPAHASDWLPTTGLEDLIPPDIQEAPWFDMTEDPEIHIVPSSSLTSVASASSVWAFP
jgi:hypothetical protein